MKGNIWAISIVVLILFSIGTTFVFNGNNVREYFFKSYKEGVEFTGVNYPPIDKYPKAWFFRLFGFIAYAFALALIYSVFWKTA